MIKHPRDSNQVRVENTWRRRNIRFVASADPGTKRMKRNRTTKWREMYVTHPRDPYRKGGMR